jgi:hypothetical protein
MYIYMDTPGGVVPDASDLMCCAVLCCAVLGCALLCSAGLGSALLCSAVLCCALLCCMTAGLIGDHGCKYAPASSFTSSYRNQLAVLHRAVPCRAHSDALGGFHMFQMHLSK